MRPSAEADLLLRAALHPDNATAARAAEQWSATADLDSLAFNLVQMLPMLAMRSDPLPLGDELRNQIENVSRVTWLRTETHARAIAPVIDDLAGAGCDPLLMKGAALVYGHGVSPRLRPMFDIDVLVEPARLVEAAELLVARGFQTKEIDGILAAEPRLLAQKHGENFTRGGGISLDLHWSPLAHMHRSELVPSLREEAVETVIAGVRCHALGRSDLLAVTLAHAADSTRHLRERWPGDCVLLIRGHEQEIDWQLLARRAREWRIAAQALDAFDYLKDVAGVELPQPTKRALAANPVPIALRLRRRGHPSRTFDDYEMEVADHVPLGARTGPADFTAYLMRRAGATSRRELAGELIFAAAGRPWRMRRKLRALLRRAPQPARRAQSWPVYSPGGRLRFGGVGPDTRFLAAGWWFPEDFGTWSRGAHSRVCLGLATPIDCDAELDFGAIGLLGPGHASVAVDVVVNEFRLLRFVFDEQHAHQEHRLVVPTSALAGRNGVAIDFVVHRPAVPAELGVAPDVRLIGFGLSELSLTPAGATQQEPA